MLRFGVCQNFDNGRDWDRFLAWEAGEQAGEQPYADADLYRDDLHLTDLVEPLGYDSLWSLEHRVSPYAMTPSPLQMLSYYAGRTSRVALGTMVLVLPWYRSPFRIAEEIAVLSHLAGGGERLRIGVGRGLGPREYAAMDIDMNEARGRYLEGIDVLRGALGADEFAWDGEYFKVARSELRPRPREREAILENMYFAPGSPDTAALVAPRGLKMIVIPQKPLEAHAEDVRVVNEIRERSGMAPARPIVCPWVYVAETEAEARRRALSAFRANAVGAYHNYQLSKERSGLAGYESYKPVSLDEWVAPDDDEKMLRGRVWGTPEMCVEQIAQLSEMFAAEEFVGIFKYAEMDRAEGEALLTLFAEQVLPQLREITPPPADRPTLRLAAIGESSRGTLHGG